MTVTLNSNTSPAFSKRFHVKGIPKIWAETTEDAGWKLYEALKDLVLVDNISVFDSKYNSKMRFAILEVMRGTDARDLMKKLDPKDRLYIADQKCFITIQKFIELPPRSSTVRQTYSRADLIALQKFGVSPPKIIASIYSYIQKTKEPFQIQI